MERHPEVFKMKNILQHRRKIFREKSYHDLNKNEPLPDQHPSDSHTNLTKPPIKNVTPSPRQTSPKPQHTSIQNLLEMDLKKLIQDTFTPAFLQDRTRQMIKDRMDAISTDQKLLEQKKLLRSRKAVTAKRIPQRTFE